MVYVHNIACYITKCYFFFLLETTVPTFFSEFTTLDFGLNRRENVQVEYDFILANTKEVST